jgi:hypothetical protein
LLFVILMDALHDGLEVNPFTGARVGLMLKLRRGGPEEHLPSLGFADDTNVLANTLANLRILHEWVLRFNLMQLNHSKCELVGRGADGAPVTEATVAAAGIAIDGHSLVPLAHSTPIRYLGVHCCLDADWSAQHRKLLATIQLFTRLVNKFRLSVSQAAYVYNTFLLPKLEISLRYIHGPQAAAWIKSYDRTLVASIEHMVSSPVRLSHSAVALAAGFLLPSWLEVAIKVSEL